MSDYNAWLGVNSPSDESRSVRYAALQWNLIQRNPNSITLVRGATALSAQTVSVQPGNEEHQVELSNGKSITIRDVVIFGVKGHPSVTDTDIQKSDQFAYLGRFYKVTDVIVNLASVQAWAEAIG